MLPPTVPPTRPIARTLAEFDIHSGGWVERILFNHRLVVIAVCTFVTVILAIFATQLQLQASFDKTIPKGHPFVVNYLAHRTELKGLGNAVRIVVANPKGTIYDAHYMEQLRRISDEVFLIPGVERENMKSLWTPSTRWVGVTEEGLEGGPVIPNDYDGSPGGLERLHANIDRSGEVGQLVSLDGRSSAIYVPLRERNADGSAFDYARFGAALERLRSDYSNGELQIYITGYAKLASDLIEGLQAVLTFFGVAIMIVAAMVFAYTRCIRSTGLVVAVSMIAVVWQLGALRLLGYGLDPYSILVPFLVFAIGMSHGAQKMNGIMQDVGRGAHKLVAARYTFRRLFLAGLTALLADAVGFAVLLIIDIQAIRELAIAASLGVAVLIFTNLILLPILLSYAGVSQTAAVRSLRSERDAETDASRPSLWTFLGTFTQPRRAKIVVVAAIVLAVGAAMISTRLQIGDLDPGAPELRPGSRYNQDVAFTNAHYGASSDVFAVMVKTPDGQCAAYDTLMRVDLLQWELEQIPGVESTNSLALLNRRVSIGLNEGNAKWYELLRNEDMLRFVTSNSPRDLYNDACNLLTVYAFLADHRADTLTRVVSHVQRFAQLNETPDVKILLAAGSSGIEAATNIVVKKAWWQMLLLVYAAVVVLCFFTFRSWRAVVVAVLPLMLTSVMAEALMVMLGIGVKVATLPVIALGVGIGIDYALYILSVTLARLRAGQPLSRAYRGSLLFTGKVVMLTGVTLSAGVATWAMSPIKFQASMGVLLAFMFVWNMVGSLVLLPALASFLLKPAGGARAAGTQTRPEKVGHDMPVV